MSEWLSDLTANRYNKTYLKGFLDVSGGDFIMRNHNIYVQSGDISLNGYLLVADDVSLNSKLFVQDNVSLNSRLMVMNDVSFNSNLNIGGDIVVRGNLSVYQQTTNTIITTVNNYNVVETVDININGKLFATSDVSFNSKLFIQSDVSFNSKLFVQLDASLNSKLTVANDTRINSKLFVQSDVSFNSKFFVANDAYFNGNLYLPTSNLHINGTSVTASATELNYLYGTTPGTSTAGLALVMSGSNDINGIRIIQAEQFVGTTIVVDTLIGSLVGAATQYKISDVSDGEQNYPHYLTLSNSSIIGSVSNAIVDNSIHFTPNNYTLTVGNNAGTISGTIITKDLSLSGNIVVNNVDISGVLDVKTHLRVPRGPTSAQPTTTTEMASAGYIRYNTDTHQFEGFGPGNSWGSLGGVVNVAQNTKVIASSPNADSTNNELIFYTAPTGDTSANNAVERMRIKADGEVDVQKHLRIPRGPTSAQPTTTTEIASAGYIRYNTDTHQFEGFGPGNAWGSLGGVVNVAQNTKIIASSPSADSTNNELIFYTAPTGNTSATGAVERMRIKANGTIDICGNLFAQYSDNAIPYRAVDLRTDISVNSLTIGRGGGNITTNIALGFSALNNSANAGGNNNAIGYQTLLNNTTGGNNNAIGYQTLLNNTTGSNNNAVGHSALTSNTDGSFNGAFGGQSLNMNNTGSFNNAFGYRALAENTTGNSNSAFGHYSQWLTKSGVNNSSFGADTLENNTTGNSNSAIGYRALFDNSSGSFNSVIGYNALENNTTGNNNTALGATTGNAITTGSNNTFLGYGTGSTVNSVSNSTAIGYLAQVTGDNQIVIGTSSQSTYVETLYPNYLYATNDISVNSLTIGKGGGNIANNSAVGYFALKNNTTGGNNSAFGSISLQNNTDGSFNSAFGSSSLPTNTTGDFNSAFGSSSLLANWNGNYNSAFGYIAGSTNSSGSFNTYLGYGADASGDAWSKSTAIGANARITASNQIVLGTSMETVSVPGAISVSKDIAVNGLTVGKGAGNVAENTAIGRFALVSNSSGNYNTAIGYASLNNNATNFYNVGVGYNALLNTRANYNTAIGSNAGDENTSGQYNTYLGYNADTNSTGHNSSTAIGYNSIITASNQIALGTASETVSVPGTITVSKDITVNSITVGEGGNSVATNTATGYLALAANFTDGIQNSAFGHQSLRTITNGNDNSAFGYFALQANSTGNRNSAFGCNALKLATNWHCAAFGYNALSSTTAGDQNTAVGSNAGVANTTGDNNTYLGYGADANGNNYGNSTAIGVGSLITASNQIALGRSSETVKVLGTITVSKDITVNGITVGKGNQSIVDNTAIGYNALVNNNTFGYASSYNYGYRNTAIGYLALANTTFGGNNTAVGASTGIANQSGLNNTYLGYKADANSASYNSSTAIGAYATITASNQIALGTSTETVNVLGTITVSKDITVNSVTVGEGGNSVATNTATGYLALAANLTDVSNNSAFGNQSLRTNTTGSNNSAFGYFSLQANSTGTKNSAFGSNALKSSTTSHCTAIGHLALGANTTGAQNTAVGSSAGAANITGANNTFLGYNANTNANNHGNSTAIGAFSVISASNQIVLGTSTETVYVPGKVGIGTTNPNSQLDVSGNIHIYGDLSLNGNLTVYRQTTSIFTTVNNYNITVTNDLSLNGSLTCSGNVTASSLTCSGNVTASSVTSTNDIAVNGITVGRGNSNTLFCTAIGYQALLANNATGYSNSAVGYQALLANTTGTNNTAIGVLAGNTNTTGSNNTFLGYSADTNSGSYSNSTAIGANARINGNNQIVLGTSNETVYIPGGLVVPNNNAGTVPGSIRYNTTSSKFEGYTTAWTSLGGGGVISDNEKVLIDASNGPGLRFFTGETISREVMRIDNSGNVGVGITNAETGAGLILPAAAFTISRPAPTVATADITPTTNFTPTELLRLQLTDNASGSPNQAIGSGAKISFYNNGDNAYGGVDSTYEMASISGIKLDNLDNNYAGGLVFCTHSNINNVTASPVATERMRITANGNVGIGKINPGAALDVSGTIICTGFSSSSQAIYTGGLDAGAGTIITYGTVQAGLLRLQNNTPVYQGGSANIELWSSTNNFPHGMIKTTDLGSNGSAYKTKMEFFVNLDSTSTASLRIALKLDATGVEAISYNATSDYRIKDNVRPLTDCSFTVDHLRPVTYNNNQSNNKQDIGLIAHELQEHYPFLVNGEKDGEHNQSVNYTGLIGLLIHEIQQLKQRVSILEQNANK